MRNFCTIFSKYTPQLPISVQRRTLTFYLHDAVYLYLLTVNQTLDEGYTDYGDGHLIRSKTIGQRFPGT